MTNYTFGAPIISVRNKESERKLIEKKTEKFLKNNSITICPSYDHEEENKKALDIRFQKIAKLHPELDMKLFDD